MNLPAVPESFYWTIESWGAALRCRPLAAVAPHLFTTRQLELSSADDWRRAAEAVGARRVQMLTQVHGREVVAVRPPNGSREGLPHVFGSRSDGAERRPRALGSSSAPPQGLPHTVTPADRPAADVLVSNDPQVAIAVRAADCVPILIADPKTGAAAAVHAGWRGTAAGAATAAIDALAREFGARPIDLVAAIGPSIGPCCYEVGPELVDAFASAGHARHLVDRWFLSPPPRRGETGRSALHLDTWGANRDQLILAGLGEENVHVCGLCTADHLDLFPSFRKEKENAGRIAGLIRARDEAAAYSPSSTMVT